MRLTYAQEGSVAHEVARMALTECRDAAAYLGRIVQVESSTHAYLPASGAHRWINCPGSLKLEGEQADEGEEEGAEGEVSEAMAEAVQVYLDHVRRHAEGGELLVEQRVTFGDAIGVPDSWGTADAVILSGTTLKVIDLKFGRGVQVFAEGNEQLMLYALGALADFGMLYDIACVELHIVQPRIDHIDVHPVAVADLEKFGKNAKVAAKWALGDTPEPMLVPGEKQCRFCRAKATCPALRNEAIGTVFEAAPATADEFAALQPVEISAVETSDDGPVWLSEIMTKADLIEDWLKAVRAEVERRLLEGLEVPGYKLVEGKRGARAWADEEQATAMLKSFRLKHDEIFNYKVISPTQADKLLSKESPKRWNKLTPLITQSGGKPSVAPVSDKRPPIQPNTAAASDFESLV